MRLRPLFARPVAVSLLTFLTGLPPKPHPLSRSLNGGGNVVGGGAGRGLARYSEGRA